MYIKRPVSLVAEPSDTHVCDGLDLKMKQRVSTLPYSPGIRHILSAGVLSSYIINMHQ